MKKYHLDDFTRGWLVGDFSPSILKTKEFEFMVRFYHVGDKEKMHVHKIVDEITVIVSGKFKINNEVFQAGDVVHILPGDVVEFICFESGATAVVKTPSVKDDKYLI